MLVVRFQRLKNTGNGKNFRLIESSVLNRRMILVKWLLSLSWNNFQNLFDYTKVIIFDIKVFDMTWIVLTINKSKTVIFSQKKFESCDLLVGNSTRNDSKPPKVEIAVAVVIFVYSSDVDNILLDILGKYHPDSDQPDAQTLREFVDNLQESKYYPLHKLM